MPVMYKQVPMAECVNCGLGNEDLRQGIMPPGPMFADMILRGMQDLKCVDLNTLPSQNEENSSTMLSLNQRDNEELASPVLNNLTNTTESPAKESSDEDSVNHKTIEKQTKQIAAENTQVPSMESSVYFLPINYNKRNPWRRISGFHTAGNELRSATYPARSSVKKLRFAQAKKPLNYLYSYFSVEILDCDDQSSITIGVSRKDYPSKMAPGKAAGSIGYFSDSGSIYVRDSVHLDGISFSKGDTIGCGIIYPPHYKRYADLSTDDNSDGMTDVVLTSLLNKKCMDFVINVLNLNVQKDESSAYDDSACSDDFKTGSEESDYYNENFVESRTQVEIYFTYNLQVIGKVLSHIPIGGFYPTVHVFSSSAILMNVDLNPPSS
ncbi:SPRY domain-containing protein 3-like [Argiope bruennichi]|uniref:SPRY domain-containing protein 3 n=1 Tax=Argiope bruennichi TaxID=94029 RepID=A0A8T0EU13_ARGBR|nr:SPRY domain-containing protein 3-like [Argiope bruennichi]KAF8778881.1 SPRY domain-containing protein 3 [Argiope bruennichi]